MLSLKAIVVGLVCGLAAMAMAAVLMAVITLRVTSWNSSDAGGGPGGGLSVVEFWGAAGPALFAGAIACAVGVFLVIRRGKKKAV